MKLSVVSDLHLDFGGPIPRLPGGDLLLIVGDTCEARSFDIHQNLSPTEMMMRADIHKFFRTVSEQYTNVAMIMGNHEHYHSTYQKTADSIRKHLPANVKLLERDAMHIDDVVVVGTTLWTDLNRRDPITMHAIADQFNGLADFKYIKYQEGNEYHKFLARNCLHEHEKSLQYLRAVVTNPKNAGKKIVVMTHHAPCSLSIAEEYKNDTIMNGGFYSDLSNFILDHPQIVLWAHGHTHRAFNYMLGETRLLCNPYGYQNDDYHEYTGFDPNLQVEI